MGKYVIKNTKSGVKFDLKATNGVVEYVSNSIDIKATSCNVCSNNDIKMPSL